MADRPTIADFILRFVDNQGHLGPPYLNNPEKTIRDSDLNQSQKDVLLSRDQQRIRKEMGAETGRDLSRAPVTIVLGMPTIILS